jgi:anti-sigma factor RsiW
VNDSKPIPDLMLERYLLGELSPQAHQQLEQHLASHPEDQARLSALREDNAKILAALPTAQVTTEVLRRQRLAAAAKTPLRRSVATDSSDGICRGGGAGRGAADASQSGR